MMKFKFGTLLSVAILVFAGSAIAWGAPPPAPPLQDLVSIALQGNPDLQAAEARWQLYRHKILPAGTLDDPQLSFTLGNFPVDTFQDNQTAMTGKIFQLSQKFPFPGKLHAKSEIAEQESLWYRAVYRDAKVQLKGLVAKAYYGLYFQDKAIAITEKNIKVLADFVRLTETRYTVGKGLQQDVLRAQVERSKLMDQLFTLRQSREETVANLNTLLGRPTATPVGTIADFDIPKIGATLGELQRDSEQNRPLYAAYRSLIERFRDQQKLARLDYYPDFTVGLSYTQRDRTRTDSGTDFVGAQIGMTLPIHRERRDEELAQAESGMRMAQAQYDQFRNQVHDAIDNAYSRAERDRQQALLYHTGLLPQARQAYDAALSSYQVGKVDFLTLLDSVLTLYRYDIDYYRVVADYRKSLAGLEAAAGSLPVASTDHSQQ